jgi:hypothetical protein
MDRRQEQRHAVERPCHVSSGTFFMDAVPGVTMNVSRAGMLVKFPGSCISELLPKIGARVRILIDLPTSANYAPRSLECTGRVVRAAGSDSNVPVLAFEIHRMLVRNSQSRPDLAARKRARLVQ